MGTATWIWHALMRPVLLGRVAFGALLLGVVFLSGLAGWVIEGLNSLRASGEVDDSTLPSPAWFQPTLKLWLFPLGCAFIADAFARAVGAVFPEAVTLAVMLAAIFVWAAFAMHPHVDPDVARDEIRFSVRLVRKPIAAMLFSFTGCGALAASVLYLYVAARGRVWIADYWAPITVVAFIGCLLGLSYWQVVTTRARYRKPTR